MARTESKVIQCHPKDEQSQIDLMHHFYWNLLSSQEIATISNTLESRGENLYSVEKSTRYIKLAFSRTTDIPHLDQIRRLEREYSLLPIPKFPKLFPLGGLLWTFLIIFSAGLMLIPWVLYFVFIYLLKKGRAQREYEQLIISRQEIIERLNYLESIPDETKSNDGIGAIKPQLKTANV